MQHLHAILSATDLGKSYVYIPVCPPTASLTSDQSSPSQILGLHSFYPKLGNTAYS